MEITSTGKRLDHYRLRLPACDRFIRLPDKTDLTVSIESKSQGGDTGPTTKLPLPFFWFDPPWHEANAAHCRDVAQAMAASGIVVAALHRDLSRRDDCDSSSFSHRMVPHRCDRAGLIYRDFENASIIDLRLVATRDENGRFAYQSSQVVRWMKADENQANEVQRGYDAMTFPPDWRSLDDMANKVTQLRQLSNAAIFVSFDASHLQTMMQAAKNADVDGVIIRVEGDPLEVISRARVNLQTINRTKSMSLWISVSQPLSAEDCVKCFAMGATGFAVDSLCNEFLLRGDTSIASSASSWRHLPVVNDFARVYSAGNELVNHWTEAVRGYAHSCGVERLSNLNEDHLENL